MYCRVSAPDETWFYPGHGKDSTLGAERTALPERRARGSSGRSRVNAASCRMRDVDSQAVAGAVPAASAAGRRAPAGLCRLVQRGRGQHDVLRDTGPEHRGVVGAADRPRTSGSWSSCPSSITHERRLTGVDEELRAFLDAIEPLGPRAHALWIQLPGSFAPADVPALGRLPAPAPRRPPVRRRGPPSRRSSTTRGRRGFSKGCSPPRTPNGSRSTPPRSSRARRPATPNGTRGRRSRAMPRRSLALTDRPIVRYLGRDATARTVEGWRPWIDVVAGWLREGRSPTVFIHTPDNADAPMLARRFHDEVRARLPELEALPVPDRPSPRPCSDRHGVRQQRQVVWNVLACIRGADRRLTCCGKATSTRRVAAVVDQDSARSRRGGGRRLTPGRLHESPGEADERDRRRHRALRRSTAPTSPRRTSGGRRRGPRSRPGRPRP